MDEEERMRVLAIQSSGFELEHSHIDILLRLYWYVQKTERDCTLVNLKKECNLDELTKVVHDKRFFDFFECRKITRTYRVSHFTERIKPERVAAENRLLQSLRVCSSEDFCDTIFIDKDLVRQPEKLIEIFDIITQSRMFLEIPELRYAPIQLSHAKPSDNKKADSWFDFCNPNSIASIFLGFLEYAIFFRYPRLD
jgi:hypothetical protein